MRAQKKPEEPVPQLDNIEQVTRKTPEGEIIQEWVKMKNSQFKHFNLCMNQIDDDVEQSLAAMLERTADDVGVTLSSNKVSEEMCARIHEKIRLQHTSNIELQQAQADSEGHSIEHIVIDQGIHLKRLAI